ncbi:Nif3-like dinuclear metal center hexameric protein [Mycoplasmopsis felis]|uniref:Nif3-like dinuclear metal center hexameric protein n=1 Tax=Mycoplasmopsis felis TaxID=33923 RepID=UPI002AF6B301|nr:Nif3-like dinuclear metal center hexameric protein [Mycoplasmopsis felis]WQQ02189.1 Nif3-like dinuclear metal center hexameric protein [Mycoplasmopsis felis]WQQ10138.1 Nif3-like dinuclear metal center hexameric protein [Mycoplasmopsis felis]
MTLKKFVKYLELKYPLQNKEPWDPSGYSVKTQQHKKITGVVLAMDLTSEVLQSAIKNNCNLILSHHPFLFEEHLKDEDVKAPYKREIIKQLRKHQITSYSLHTNYDGALYGTSYQIVKYLDLLDFYDRNSEKYSATINKEFTIDEISHLIKEKLLLSEFRTNVINHNQKFKKICFLSGSGYIGQINQLVLNGIDLIITSDLKWSDWINYQEIKANILEIPHLDEEVFAFDLQEQLNNELPDLKVIVKKIKQPYRNM